MKCNYRLAGYFIAAVLLIGLMSMSQQAWATPSQTHGAQTIPTRTPTPGPGTTSQPPTSRPPTSLPPTSPPRPTTSPTPMPQPATGTPAPPLTLTSVAPTPVPTDTTQSVVGALSLAVVVDRLQVWHGLTISYTVTIANLSGSAVRDIVLVDVLPVGLEPGVILSGANAVWQGRTLRAEKADLAPGEQYQLVFRAVVGDSARAGTIIVNSASAVAMSVSEATASAAVTMPPAELPQVGGS